MKTMDITKRTVLGIGSLAILSGTFGIFAGAATMTVAFAIYTGCILIGSVLLHKDGITNYTKA
ncbi:hypothetical protein [Croceivirga sp. JEA036]|uniref:hypothetical protein n=1 Tax=Croceivirga sp. JEA036 TaxID=2721162 RepID=UPI0014390596|nr:hypothetical protein [Croceivirga sp. JEA036]NJB37215.1 hypothetical protein [Croceivirga sp. JEA036]